MQLTKKIGVLLLGIFLILTGLFPLIHVGSETISVLMNLLAIAAGGFLLVDK